MSLTFKGITPKWLMDTRDMQNNTPTVGSTFGGVGQGMSRKAEGVCATLSCFWLSHAIQGEFITDPKKFPSQFQLSIAQGSYVLGGGSENALMDRFGLSILSQKLREKRWYNFRKTKVERAAAQMEKNPGYYYFCVDGKDGGHAMAAVTKGYALFFDPNIGLLNFTSLHDMRVWLIAFIVKWYPELLDDTEVYGVG